MHQIRSGLTLGLLVLLSGWFNPINTTAQPGGLGFMRDHAIAAARPPQPRKLKSVAFGNNIFVAVGPSMTILTSVDGKDWANYSSEIKNVTANINFTSETYAANGDAVTFVSIANMPQQPFTPITTNLRSMSEFDRHALLDSIHQKAAAYRSRLPIRPVRLYGVTFGGGVFVIVGDCGEILTSQDGKHWSAPASKSSDFLTGVAWGNPGYVVVGDKGTILTSPDGSNWTKRNSGTASTLFAVAYGNGTFVVVGEHGTVLTSNDGIQWASADAGPILMAAIAFGNGLFMGTGADTDFPGKIYSDNHQTMVSTDGKNWQAVKHPYPPLEGQVGDMTINGSSGGTTSLNFGGGRFIATSTEGVYTSINGNSWIPSTEPYGFKSSYSGAAFGNGTFVAVGDGSTIGTNHNRTFWATIATSKDANTWELSQTPPSRLTWGPLEDDKRFRLPVGPRMILMPMDEDTWIAPDKISVPGAVFGNIICFYYGDLSRQVVLASKDGVVWTRLGFSHSDHPNSIVTTNSIQSANGVLVELNGLSYKLNLTVEIGQSMEIQASTNLVAWEILTTITNTGGILKYTDSDATNYPMRFYRLKLQ